MSPNVRPVSGRAGILREAHMTFFYFLKFKNDNFKRLFLFQNMILCDKREC